MLLNSIPCAYCSSSRAFKIFIWSEPLMSSQYIYTRIIYLFYPYFKFIVVASILPKVEPCTTCNLNDLVPCSIGI